MAIALADLLDEKLVALTLRSRKPANAVREIIQLLTNNGKIDNAEKFLEQVLLREQAHPSVVEYSVAFPHARTDLVDQIVIGIGRSRAGERLVNDYLICVGTLARLVKDDATRSALLHAQTSREFLDVLTTE